MYVCMYACIILSFFFRFFDAAATNKVLSRLSLYMFLSRIHLPISESFFAAHAKCLRRLPACLPVCLRRSSTD